MLTRITDWKIPCLYIHFYEITKNRGPGSCNSLHHTDKIWTCSCREKCNFMMINEFKYGQT